MEIATLILAFSAIIAVASVALILGKDAIISLASFWSWASPSCPGS